jgi:hypothetical protein
VTSSRPADPFIRAIVDHLAATGGIPTGWEELPVEGVGRPVLAGPGGLVVLAAREPASPSVEAGLSRPWRDGRHDQRRDRRSALQLTADLVGEVVEATTGVRTTCAPVVVIADDHTTLIPRGDDVPLVHHRRLARWLEQRPVVLDADQLARVRSIRPGAASGGTTATDASHAIAG